MFVCVCEGEHVRVVVTELKAAERWRRKAYGVKKNNARAGAARSSAAAGRAREVAPLTPTLRARQDAHQSLAKNSAKRRYTAYVTSLENDVHERKNKKEEDTRVKE